MDKSKVSKKKQLYIGIGAGLLIVIAIVSALVLHFSNRDMIARNIRVNEIEGEVTVIREEMDSFAAYADMNLVSGDVIITNKGARAILRLDDDKYVVLAENTKICLQAKGDSKNSKTMIELSYGEVLSDIRSKLSDKSTYEVETPSSTMSVRGTVFSARVIGPAGSVGTGSKINKNEYLNAVEAELIMATETPKDNKTSLTSTVTIKGAVDSTLKDGSEKKIVGKLKQVCTEVFVKGDKAAKNMSCRFIGGIAKADLSSLSNSILQYLRDEAERIGLDTKITEELDFLLNRTVSPKDEEGRTTTPPGDVSESQVSVIPSKNLSVNKQSTVNTIRKAIAESNKNKPILKEEDESASQKKTPLPDMKQDTVRTTPSPTASSPATPSPVTPSPVTPSPVTPSPVAPSPVAPSPVAPSPDEYVDFSLWQPELVKAVYATLEKAEDSQISKTEISQMTQIDFSVTSGFISNACFTEVTQNMENVTKIILDGKPSSSVDHFPVSLSTSKISSLSWRNAGLTDASIESNAITNLLQLEELDLSGNQLTILGGSTAVESNTGDNWKFNNLTKLTKLNLANNLSLSSFGGLVPINTFMELDVSGTSLTWSIMDVRDLMKDGGNLTDHSIVLKDSVLQEWIRDNGYLADGKVYPRAVKMAFYDSEIWNRLYYGSHSVKNLTTLEDIKYIAGVTGIHCMEVVKIPLIGIQDVKNIKSIRFGWCDIITEGELIVFPESLTELELRTSSLKVNGESYKASDVDWSKLTNLTRLVIDGIEITDIATYKAENQP